MDSLSTQLTNQKAAELQNYVDQGRQEWDQRTI